MPPTTGWITLTPTADWKLATAAPAFRVKRSGDRVTLLGRLERVTAGASRTAGSPVWQSTQGFRPTSYTVLGPGYLAMSASALTLHTLVSGSRIDVAGAGTWATGDPLAFEVSWNTDDSWPTT